MDAGEVFKDVVDAAPSIVKAAQLVADLIQMWCDGSDAEKEAAEAQAKAMVEAMNGARADAVVAHEANQKKIDQAIDAAEHPTVVVPPKLGE
jgi:hypothetical protein